jgi:DNA ligase-1
LIPIGAYYGDGNRSGMYGGFLMAVYNKDTNNFESICKVGTGFKWVELTKLTESLDKYRISKPDNYIVSKKSFQPDVWISPHFIWEIKADSFTNSKNYDFGSDFVQSKDKKPEDEAEADDNKSEVHKITDEDDDNKDE